MRGMEGETAGAEEGTKAGAEVGTKAGAEAGRAGEVEKAGRAHRVSSGPQTNGEGKTNGEGNQKQDSSRLFYKHVLWRVRSSGLAQHYRQHCATLPSVPLPALTASGLKERTTIQAKTTPEYPHETWSLSGMGYTHIYICSTAPPAESGH